MYQVLHHFLKDQKGEEIFTCFGLWHILYMALIFGLILFVVFRLRRMEEAVRRRVVKATINIAFGLYAADFFLMPFAYSSIDLEKLPFHMCTLMCVLSFLSANGVLFPSKSRQFAQLGLVSNLIYVIYPAGVGWYQIHPLSYRVVQTLLFHGTMSAYGIFTLTLGDAALKWKDSWKELPIIVFITLWAVFGNWLYNGSEGMIASFNWFFVVRDPFHILPADIAPYIMPFVMIIVIFVSDILIYGAYFAIRKLRRK